MRSSGVVNYIANSSVTDKCKNQIKVTLKIINNSKIQLLYDEA